MHCTVMQNSVVIVWRRLKHYKAITMEINNICIYCASSNKAAEVYGDTAYELGALLAKEGITVITGAGGIGLMRMVEDGALDNGGKAIGVIPQFMVDQNWHHTGLTELRTLTLSPSLKITSRERRVTFFSSNTNTPGSELIGTSPSTVFSSSAKNPKEVTELIVASNSSPRNFSI